MKKWFLILLVLAVPAIGFAAQENEVVALPTVAPLPIAAAEPAADYTNNSLKEYYASLDKDFDTYQLPHMTAEEAERAQALSREYQAGVRPEQSVLDKLENVTVGVYTLNPVDYDGETLFTLLPVHPLTDEEILEVIDAFAQSGQTFDPGALTYKNCMRGGGVEASRFFQAEETERRATVRELYVRQSFVSEKVYTPLVSDDGLGKATLDPEAYCGLDSFLFLPMRAMTDDELLRYVIYSQTSNPVDYSHYAAYEKQLRQEMIRLLGAPLAMTLEFENTGVMGDYDVSYDDERVYYACFDTPDGVSYSGYLDLDTSEVLHAWLYWTETLAYSDLHLDPFDGKWLLIAKEAVQTLRTDGAAIADAQSLGEVRLNEGGFGVTVDVIMEDGGYYRLTIAYQNDAPTNGISYQSHTPDAERMYGTVQE